MVKPSTEKHIRKLAREDVSANFIVRQLRREGKGVRRQTALRIIREERGPKHVAVYGKKNGISKRMEAYGTGKRLGSLLIDVVKHPPKKRITRVNADKIRGLSDRFKYIDYKEEWDERPTIKS